MNRWWDPASRSGLSSASGTADYTGSRVAYSATPSCVDTPSVSTKQALGFLYCPQSVNGHDVGGTRDGTCTWCGRQVDSRPARPQLGRGYLTKLDLAYRRFYDPDWGSDAYDTDA